MMSLGIGLRDFGQDTTIFITLKRAGVNLSTFDEDLCYTYERQEWIPCPKN